MLRTIITQSVFFRPKQLREPWEHKCGFLVEFESKAALNLIYSTKDKNVCGFGSHNSYLGFEYEVLRRLASVRLREIQSSQNNYIDALCVVGGLFSTVYIFSLVPVVWSGSSLHLTRLLIVSIVILATLVALYLFKTRIDKENIKNFLDIEDAIYYKKYGSSQYN